MTAYYNEIDPYAAQWLRNLIAARHIAPGDVDERSIRDVTPADLAGYTQCHFFAGVGVWSYALRLAGWPDDRPVWTGSCPCQPFSAAGRGDGAADPRHLWPTWIKLIRERRPNVCFGEQVASRDGLAWLDLVHADLEAAGYAVGALDLCAAGFGAPHIRQRLYFVADAERNTGEPGRATVGPGSGDEAAKEWSHAEPGRRGNARRSGRLDDAQHANGRPEYEINGSSHRRDGFGRGGANGILGDAGQDRHTRRELERSYLTEHGSRQPHEPAIKSNPSFANGYWSDAEWLVCRDGKARATKPGLFPLAHGASARVGRLRAYGNAIVAPQAAEFIRAYMSVAP